MAVAVYYNNTGQAACFYNGPTRETPVTRLPGHRLAAAARQRGRGGSCSGDWGWQWCTEITQPFSSGSDKDMFWPPSTFSLDESIQSCNASYGVIPRAYWASTTLASRDLSAASNIVFSNGGYDPWHGGGVLANVSESVIALMIPSGAHHIDLMFSDPADPPDVIAARQVELEHISSWISSAQP